MNTQTRMFDRNSYTQRTISIYQIVGAYFVDVYYNHLYVAAVKLKNQGKVPSITEGYKHATYAFISTLDNKSKSTYKVEHYTKLLTEINNYFILWTSYNSLTLSDCIDKIVKEFIPNDFHQNLDKDQKRNILRTILINSIKEFTKIIITEYLSTIIDNHDDPANTDLLKERIIDIFIAERESMYHKFLLPKSAKDEVVDKKFAEKMRSEISKLHEERLKMLKVIKDYEKEVDSRKEQLTKVLLKYRSIESTNKSSVDENKNLKDKNIALEQRVSDLKYKVEQLEMQLRQEKDSRAAESRTNATDRTSIFTTLSRAEQNNTLSRAEQNNTLSRADELRRPEQVRISNNRLNNAAFLQKIKDIENYNSDDSNDSDNDNKLKNKVEQQNKNVIEQQNKNKVEAKNKNVIEAKNKNVIEQQNKNVIESKNKNKIEQQNKNVIEVKNKIQMNPLLDDTDDKDDKYDIDSKSDKDDKDDRDDKYDKYDKDDIDNKPKNAEINNIKIMSNSDKPNANESDSDDEFNNDRMKFKITLGNSSNINDIY